MKARNGQRISPSAVARTVFDDGALRVTKTGSPPGLAITGDVDEFTYSGLVRALKSVTGAGEIHVDLAGVQYCDLAGLLAIIGLTRLRGHRHFRRSRRVALDEVPPQLRTALRIVGWDTRPGLALHMRVPSASSPEPPRLTLLPAGDGGVHFPERDLGWLGGGDLLPAGRREPHRIALGQRPGILEGDGPPRHEQVQERGCGELDLLARAHPGGM
jgi:ABC-type transporter Mla MlaB component